MAFHDQHERTCPTCGERISATAPKCLNCGEYVRDAAGDETDDVEPADGRRNGVVLVLVLACVAALAYLIVSQPGRPKVADPADVRELHRVLGQLGGKPDLNATSTVALADVVPHLRVGMPLAELNRLVSLKDAGQATRTTTGTVPLADGAQGYLLYLRDADLLVEVDAAGVVVAWTAEPAR